MAKKETTKETVTEETTIIKKTIPTVEDCIKNKVEQLAKLGLQEKEIVIDGKKVLAFVKI